MIERDETIFLRVVGVHHSQWIRLHLTSFVKDSNPEHTTYAFLMIYVIDYVIHRYYYLSLNAKINKIS